MRSEFTLPPGQFRAKHASNPAPCCASCLGWCISEGSDGICRIERCDECWHFYDDHVKDDDAAQLPEAQQALRAAQLDAAS